HPLAIRPPEKNGSHAPRPADRGIATRHWYGLEVSRALESRQVRHEELSAPDLAVDAVAVAIPGHADGGPVHPVLGQTARDVGGMMRNGHPLHILERLRVERGAIRRVEVVRNDFRGEIEQTPEVADRLDESTVRALARQIAEMLTEKRFAVSHQ